MGMVKSGLDLRADNGVERLLSGSGDLSCPLVICESVDPCGVCGLDGYACVPAIPWVGG
jgi:hypothetical protein